MSGPWSPGASSGEEQPQPDGSAAAEGAPLPGAEPAGRDRPAVSFQKPAPVSQNSQPPRQASPSFLPPPTQPISASHMATESVVDSGNAGGGPREAGDPPPAPPQQQFQQQQQQQPLDSLSLSQLRRLASELPRNEPITYDFTYEDMGDFDEEVDEWFSYQIWQWVRLNYAQQYFESRWERLVSHPKEDDNSDNDDNDDGNDNHYSNEYSEGREGGGRHDREPRQRGDKKERTWDTVDGETQELFVAGVLKSLESGKHRERPEVLGCLVYLLLGRWGATASGRDPEGKRSSTARTVARPRQLFAMKAGAALVGKLGGIPILWKALRKAFEPFW